MAEIINLRLARKQKARDAKERSAAENRALHGRPKAERDLDKARSAKAQALLAGHKRDLGETE